MKVMYVHNVCGVDSGLGMRFYMLPVWYLDLRVSGAMAYAQFAIPAIPPANRTRPGLN